jgi:ADP-heptose:LPS heptosyltransferase
VSASAEKILAIQFKYLGDAVFITPALRALREHWPAAELHVLVAAEVAPLLEHLPWLNRVWALPRTRGRARLRDSWPLVRALRREGFGRAVDFGGNYRGAILAWLSGARQRLGPVTGTKLLHKFGYTQTVSPYDLPPDWVRHHLGLLAAWQVPPPRSAHLEIGADPALADEAAKLLASGCVVCHLGTSQPRKEWPPAQWAEFSRLAAAAGYDLRFTAGPSAREQALLAELKRLAPGLRTLPAAPSLKMYLALLRRARAVIAGDTGPLHFAAGLGVPVVGLFATGDSLRKAAPIYNPACIVRGDNCVCDARQLQSATCAEAHPCIDGIRPAAVLAALQTVI